MHNVLKAVNACDFALATLVGSPNDGYLVIFADWYRADLIGNGIELEKKNVNIPTVYAVSRM